MIVELISVGTELLRSIYRKRVQSWGLTSITRRR